jgi:hypothetical protein
MLQPCRSASMAMDMPNTSPFCIMAPSCMVTINLFPLYSQNVAQFNFLLLQNGNQMLVVGH